MRTLLFSFSLILLVSCNPDLEKMTVIKDCTGIYLRSASGTDYKVCNEEDVSGYSNGETVKAKYEKLEECFGILEPSSCPDEHPFNSKIEVTEIK